VIDSESLAKPITDTKWMRKAACHGMDVNMFFPTDGVNLPDSVRAICNSCPVKMNCFIYAESNYIDHGTFGGMSAGERKDKRKTHGRTSSRFEKYVKMTS